MREPTTAQLQKKVNYREAIIVLQAVNSIRRKHNAIVGFSDASCTPAFWRL